MRGAQVLKLAGAGITGNLLAAGVGRVAFTPMIICTVTAIFVTTAATDRLRYLRRGPLTGIMAALEGLKFGLDRVPNLLRALHLVPGLHRGSGLTGYHLIGLLEALQLHYTLVAATEHQTRATISIITLTLDMILPPIGVTMGVVSIAGTHQRITMQVITTIPRDRYITTTTTEAMRGILMGPGTNPPVLGLWPTIIVRFPRYSLL